MRGRLYTKSLIVLVLLVVGTAARAQQLAQPFGVFGKIDVESATNQCVKMHPTQDVHQCLQTIYRKVLHNEAISGLTIGLYWNTLSQTDTACGSIECNSFGGYDWSWLDDVFAVAGPQGRPVQLLLTAGFASPQWVLHQLIPCDTLFTTGSAPKDCASLKFSKYPGQPHTAGAVLPLPWPSSSNYTSFYLYQWTKFLGDLKNHVLQSKYAASLVAISLAGPTSASSEIIMPTTADHAQLAGKASGESVDDAWNKVIANAVGTVFAQDEQNTDQPFIDAWTQTFQAYTKTFGGLTLILIPDLGDKLPEYGVTSVTPAKHEALFDNICSDYESGGLYPLSCYAKTQILANFAAAQSESNPQAIQVGGMSASSTLKPGDIGLPAVKCFATSSCLQSLKLNPPLSFVGGAEFDYAATIDSSSKQQELGCPTAPEKDCLDLTPELIAFNVFADFFDSTQVEGEFMGIANNEIADAAGTSSPHYMQYNVGSLRIQYVDVSYKDVLYANENMCPSESNKYIRWMSMQDVLNMASYYLHTINNYGAQVPAVTCFKPPPPPPPPGCNGRSIGRCE
jgi:hypothetical protein